LSFKKQHPKQNSVICLKSNILPPKKFWAGYAAGTRVKQFTQKGAKSLKLFGATLRFKTN